MSDEDDNSDSEALSGSSSEEDDDEDLDHPDYKNWVRAAKSLEYLQQGLFPFVSTEICDKVTSFIQGLQAASGQSVQPACTVCTEASLLAEHPSDKCVSKDKMQCYCSRQKNKRKLCPNGICGKLYHFIVEEHRSKEPLWKNSDVAKWCSDFWYVAKCFMTSKSTDANSANSTDAAGLLSIIINATFFQQKLTCKIDPGKDVFSKARNARNEILHKADMKLSEQELYYYIDLFVAVLHDHKTLLNDENAKNAVERLLKLKDNQIHISIKEKKTILLARKEALKALKVVTERASEDIHAKTVDAIQCIDDKKANVLEELEEFKAVTISDIEMKQKEDNTAEIVTNLEERLKQVEECLQNLSLQEQKRSISRHHSQDESQEPLASESAHEHHFVNNEIKTDADLITNVEDNDVPLREYQKELAEEGVKGSNVVIMAPTNSGKTRVACKIIQEHFRKRKEGKVIFLVEKEALAFQQGKVFGKNLPAYRTKVISGIVQREKKTYLKDFVHMRDILVVTAQVLLNALRTKEVDSLGRFSLIVFDECHHTHDSHPYNEIMGHYFDLKFASEKVTPLPQIIGLTASLGVGGNTDTTAAINHMQELLINLDTACLCTVRRNKEELVKIENRAKEDIVVAEGRVKDLYKEAVHENMLAIDNYMINHPSLSELPPMSNTCITKLCRVPANAGDVAFQNWLSDFKKALCDISSERVRKMMFQCWEHLEIYNKSLLVHADARIKDAKRVLVDFMKEQRSRMKEVVENETDKMLLGLYENLERKSFDTEPENPKLLKLGELINDILGNDDNARGIVFVKTRDLARAISNWMNEADTLRKFNANECVGQAASADKGGMTRSKQKNVLDYFRGGHHKVMIATSIAEEGLDITKCNLVIRYEHVTNEIVRLQSRGRARAANSKYFVLTEVGSWIVAKEEKNKMLEALMNQIVPVLQAKIDRDQTAWQQQLTEEQTKRRQRQEERNEKDSRARMTDNKELHCFKCNKFICFSSDIRRIQGTQHVVIDEGVQKRITWSRKPNPRFKNDDLQFDGFTLCGNISCKQKLGGVCTYKGTEFPLIAICNFLVVDENKKGVMFKKWKDVNFSVEDYNLEQFDEILYERNVAKM